MKHTLMALGLVLVLAMVACAGSEGEKGIPGERGLQGEAGPQGQIGLQGDQGIQGEHGSQGAQGSQGIPGENGEQGPQGAAGAAADQGAPGPRGVVGPRGAAGATGARGSAGPQGQVGPSGPAVDLADLVSRVKDSVVKVKSPRLSWSTAGTGFFVAPSCSIATSRHVVEELDGGTIAPNLNVELQSGQVVRVTVAYDLQAKDLVLLTPARSIDCQELPMSDDPARLGQLVLLLGFPDLGGVIDSLSATPGYVVNVGQNFTADFHLAATSNFGSSGSPVLDAQGQVVGMVGGD